MKRKTEGTAVIERLDYPNKGRFTVTDADGSAVRGTIKNTIPGQTIHFRVFKKHKGRVECSIVETLKRSPLETRNPVCDIFGECGGCVYQMMPYESQMDMKSDMTKRLLEPVLSPDSVFDGIKASPREFGFRNKMDFSFGNEEKGGELRLGLHRKQTRYTVLNADTCKTVHPDMTKILTCVREYCLEKDLPIYNKVTHEGFLRFLLIRRSEATGEILICLAHTTQMSWDWTELGERLKGLELNISLNTDSDFDQTETAPQEIEKEDTSGSQTDGESEKIEGNIVGFFEADDDSYGDALKPEEVRCVFGRNYMTEKLLGLEFQVTLFSFFQTNSGGAEVLYDVVRQYVKASSKLSEKPVIYDLYCGTGTIAQVVSGEADKVYGIEIIPEAVEAAKENAKRNHITNCEFFAGDVLETLPSVVEKARPDYLILDPPREGIRPATLRRLMEFDVNNMVYVSCKASSFVQDMNVMKDYGWKIKRYAFVDMFPQAAHVEVVVLLTRQVQQKDM